MNNYEKLAKIAVHKSLLKEYSNSSNERIVYMNDDTEFQIQIFNPYDYVIGVGFDFNNKSVSSQMLVLKPGERVWLDRYLDDESKLLFSTYKVNNSKQVKEAIKNNGNLCIRFYKEQSNYNYNPTSITYEKKWYNNLDPIIYNTNDYNYTNVSSIANTAPLSASYCSINTSSAATASSFLTQSSLTQFNNKIETGRIEKGSHSNQKFTNVYKDFESFPFKTENIKILPASQKQYNSIDLIKRYCPECGRKIKYKFKYCPFCGAKL